MQITIQPQEIGLFIQDKQQQLLENSFNTHQLKLKYKKSHDCIKKKKQKNKTKQTQSVKKPSPQKSQQDQNKLKKQSKQKKKKTLKREGSNKLSMKKLEKNLLVQNQNFQQPKIVEQQDFIKLKSRVKQSFYHENTKRKQQNHLGLTTKNINHGCMVIKVNQLPKKKTIISKSNLFLRPIYNQSFQDNQWGDEIFGSLDDYLNNPQTIQPKIHKKQIESQPNQNQKKQQKDQETLKIGQKFLSKIIRKNHTEHYRHRQENQITQNSKGIFQNDQISNFLETSPIKQPKRDMIEDLSTRLNLDNSKILRIKTEVIHTFQIKSLEKQKNSSESNNIKHCSSKKKQASSSKKQSNNLIKNQQSTLEYISSNKSSLTQKKFPDVLNSLQSYLSHEIIHQYYQNKSNKLLKYSQAKNKNFKNQNKEDEQYSTLYKHRGTLYQQKYKQSKEKSPLKLPLIADVFYSKEKSLLHTNHMEKDFKKYQNQSNTQNIRERLKCYTQSKSTQNKIQAQSINIRNFSNLSKNQNSSLNQKQDQVKKSLSTKIIQNFNDRYNKKLQKQAQGVSRLDMSQNVAIRWKDSFEWKQRKKHIIKKLGVKI